MTTPEPDRRPPVSRARRCNARLIDFVLILLPVLVAGYIAGRSGQAPPQGTLADVLDAITGSRGVAVAVTINFVFVVLVVQAFLIARTSRSVGKWAVGLAIERIGGGSPGLFRGFVIRELIPLVVAVLPYGPLLVLIDYLLAFNPHGRCVHDFLAKTQVVAARDAAG